LRRSSPSRSMASRLRWSSGDGRRSFSGSARANLLLGWEWPARIARRSPARNEYHRDPDETRYGRTGRDPMMRDPRGRLQEGQGMARIRVGRPGFGRTPGPRGEKDYGGERGVRPEQDDARSKDTSP